MIKRILLFSGIDISNNILNIFSNIVADGLRKRNIEVGFVDLNSDLGNENRRAGTLIESQEYRRLGDKKCNLIMAILK